MKTPRRMVVDRQADGDKTVEKVVWYDGEWYNVGLFTCQIIGNMVVRNMLPSKQFQIDRGSRFSAARFLGMIEFAKMTTF